MSVVEREWRDGDTADGPILIIGHDTVERSLQQSDSAARSRSSAPDSLPIETR